MESYARNELRSGQQALCLSALILVVAAICSCNGPEKSRGDDPPDTRSLNQKVEPKAETALISSASILLLGKPAIKKGATTTLVAEVLGSPVLTSDRWLPKKRLRTTWSYRDGTKIFFINEKFEEAIFGDEALFRRDGTYLTQIEERQLNNRARSYSKRTYNHTGNRELAELDMTKEVAVKGYFKKDGTWVRAHTRRAPGTARWKTQGSTGHYGTRATGRTWVRPYRRSNGTYVRGHYRNR